MPLVGVQTPPAPGAAVGTVGGCCGGGGGGRRRFRTAWRELGTGSTRSTRSARTARSTRRSSLGSQSVGPHHRLPVGALGSWGRSVRITAVEAVPSKIHGGDAPGRGGHGEIYAALGRVVIARRPAVRRVVVLRHYALESRGGVATADGLDLTRQALGRLAAVAAAGAQRPPEGLPEEGEGPVGPARDNGRGAHKQRHGAP
mmetsp:Transcript_13598/g.29449  ORF Transcript_13598/g.29449 Transcript_13598/m.29449 type:complete len:201 (+) Transcript_13598:431-1033(+)